MNRKKQKIQIKPSSECRYDERLKTKAEKSTRLTYTGLIGELEHLKITHLNHDKFWGKFTTINLMNIYNLKLVYCL
jgi:hypothetical protein